MFRAVELRGGVELQHQAVEPLRELVLDDVDRDQLAAHGLASKEGGSAGGRPPGAGSGRNSRAWGHTRRERAAPLGG